MRTTQILGTIRVSEAYYKLSQLQCQYLQFSLSVISDIFSLPTYLIGAYGCVWVGGITKGAYTKRTGLGLGLGLWAEDRVRG